MHKINEAAIKVQPPVISGQSQLIIMPKLSSWPPRASKELVYFFLADFFLMVFLAAGFFAGDFFLAAAGFFLAGDFLAAAGFLAGVFFLAAAGFLAMVFFTAGFLAFLAAAGFCNKGHGGPTSAQADVARGRCPVARMHKGGRRMVRGRAG